MNHSHHQISSYVEIYFTSYILIKYIYDIPYTLMYSVFHVFHIFPRVLARGMHDICDICGISEIRNICDIRDKKKWSIKMAEQTHHYTDVNTAIRIFLALS